MDLEVPPLYKLATVSRSLNPLSRVLYNFRSHYLSTIDIWDVFSLRWNIPPLQVEILDNPTQESLKTYSNPVAGIIECTGLAPTLTIPALDTATLTDRLDAKVLTHKRT